MIAYYLYDIVNEAKWLTVMATPTLLSKFQIDTLLVFNMGEERTRKFVKTYSTCSFIFIMNLILSCGCGLLRHIMYIA